MIKEKHGIAGARKISCAKPEDCETQSIIVTGTETEVLLTLSANSFPAGLTPDQAEFISACLLTAAAKVRANG